MLIYAWYVREFLDPASPAKIGIPGSIYASEVYAAESEGLRRIVEYFMWRGIPAVWRRHVESDDGDAARVYHHREISSIELDDF